MRKKDEWEQLLGRTVHCKNTRVNTKWGTEADLKPSPFKIQSRLSFHCLFSTPLIIYQKEKTACPCLKQIVFQKSNQDKPLQDISSDVLVHLYNNIFYSSEINADEF